jgi:hypothetical protein
MGAIHPRWHPWSYLLYVGGFTLLAAAAALLGWFAGHYGAFKYAVLSFLVFAGFAFVARALRRDGRHPIAAGLFAFAAVWLFAGFLIALYHWFGWLDDVASGSSSPFGGFSVARLSLVLLTLIAALIARGAFRFPLLTLVVVELTWLFVTDLISNGGDWSAIVTFVVGLLFLFRARSADAGPDPVYGMWLHVGAGLTIGGSLLWFLHHGHFEWALIVVAALLYVKLAEMFDRASWAVFGSIGILAAATHYATSWSHASVSLVASDVTNSGSRGWVPSVVFGVAGALLMALGGLLANRRRTSSV